MDVASFSFKCDARIARFLTDNSGYFDSFLKELEKYAFATLSVFDDGTIVVDPTVLVIFKINFLRVMLTEGCYSGFESIHIAFSFMVTELENIYYKFIFQNCKDCAWPDYFVILPTQCYRMSGKIYSVSTCQAGFIHS